MLEENLKGRIQVVEDSRLLGKDMMSKLKGLGYTVTSITAFGREAIEQAKLHKPDLVLMDIVLEGEMDGIEAANEIIKRFDIPVIYVTSYANNKPLIERAVSTKPSAFLIKPIKNKTKELEIAIEIAIYRHRVEKALRESEENVKKHATRMEKALSRSSEVLHFLAKSPRLLPLFTVSRPYMASKAIAGGDIIRWLGFRAQYAGIYIHDVSGHDIEEILLNILATALVDDYKIFPSKKSVTLPSIFLRDMNNRLQSFCAPTGHYITAAYLLMDFNSGVIQLSLGGHPKPWLIKPDGSAEQIGEYGCLIGVFKMDNDKNAEYVDVSLKLKDGEILLLYSDGLMEERSKSDDMKFEKKFQNDVIPKIAGKDPETAYDILKSEFESHLDGQIPEDDVSFIFIGTRPEEKYETYKFVPSKKLLESMIDEAVNIRKLVLSKLIESYKDSEDHALEPGCNVIDDVSEPYKSIIQKIKDEGWPVEKIAKINMVLNELIINAIIHGGLNTGKIQVILSHAVQGDVLEVSVSDEGVGLKYNVLAQTITDDDINKELGRGHHIIGKYSDGIYFNESGNTMWVLFQKNSF